MYVPGHVAVALLLERSALRARWGVATGFVVLGALAPDLLDKPIRALGWLPWGRTVGHSVWMLALLCLTTLLLRERDVAGWRRAAWFTLGVASHLAADLAADVEAGLVASGYVLSGWMLWPWSDADHLQITSSPCLSANRWYTLVEAACIVELGRRWRRSRRAACAAPGGDDRETIG